MAVVDPGRNFSPPGCVGSPWDLVQGQNLSQCLLYQTINSNLFIFREYWQTLGFVRTNSKKLENRILPIFHYQHTSTPSIILLLYFSPHSSNHLTSSNYVKHSRNSIIQQTTVKNKSPTIPQQFNSLFLNLRPRIAFPHLPPL